jgi:hypothetical protein
VRTLLFTLVLGCWAIQAQPSRGTTLALTVKPECTIGTVSQSQADPNSEIVTFNYKIRTAGAGGQGRIMLRFTIASPPNYPAGSKIEYQITLGGPGTPSSGVTTPEDILNSGIVVAQFGSEAHSSRAGDLGTVQLKLNPPSALPFELQPSFSISCQ